MTQQEEEGVILILATSIARTNDTLFAKKKHERNQALSQVNNVGNEVLPLNVGSQNIAPQIQGDENGTALTSQQVFPETTEEAP